MVKDTVNLKKISSINDRIVRYKRFFKSVFLYVASLFIFVIFICALDPTEWSFTLGWTVLWSNLDATFRIIVPSVLAIWFIGFPVSVYIWKKKRFVEYVPPNEKFVCYIGKSIEFLDLFEKDKSKKHINNAKKSLIKALNVIKLSKVERDSVLHLFNSNPIFELDEIIRTRLVPGLEDGGHVKTVKKYMKNYYRVMQRKPTLDEISKVNATVRLDKGLESGISKDKIVGFIKSDFGILLSFVSIPSVIVWVVLSDFALVYGWIVAACAFWTAVKVTRK
ncbi:MAG: hypothetical protein JSV63_04355 [Candidatus Aenigmatarchaeota archaeon]|nr:MAG: hypothetical protein JSV63_04355 [Candidatus Aenigmarchaeota archaeon]